MSRLIIKSRLEDIKSFMNLIPERIKKISESDSTPLAEEYGVNALSARIHPKSQKLKISDIKTLCDGIKIISFVTATDNKLAFFRAGQSICIKHGGCSYPYSLICKANNRKYEIVVFEDEDNEVSKHLFNCRIGDIIESSGPEGLFYYTALRDQKQVVAVCDIYGMPAVISMAKSIAAGIESFKLKIISCDKNHTFKALLDELPEVSVEYYETVSDITDFDACAYSVFISGKTNFCKSISERFGAAGRKIRTNIVNITQKHEESKKHLCKVKYRDMSFEFFCGESQTLLSAFEKNGVPSASKCKVGECGYCRCRLVEGNVETISLNEIDSRRSADIKYGFIHPCRAFPKSDLIIEL